MPDINPIDVFISSTCYDLADLRAELAQFLKDRGLVVRVSEDPESAFFVEPHGDSIVSCLKNVEASRAVIAIIDRRYGPTLPIGTNGAGLSASQAEIQHAQDIQKPVFFFIREAALIEYHRLRKEPTFDAKWIEAQNRDLWRAFLMRQFSIPQHANRSNWYDQFKTSVDLKQTVLHRLIQNFPEYAGSLAMRGDRLVRMVFIYNRSTITAGANVIAIEGAFENIGIGPALNIRHGLRHGDIVLHEDRQGGISECRNIAVRYGRDGQPLEHFALYCEYENRFGDGYRIEVPIGPACDPKLGNPREERLLVRVGTKTEPKWQRVL